MITCEGYREGDRKIRNAVHLEDNVTMEAGHTRFEADLHDGISHLRSSGKTSQRGASRHLGEVYNSLHVVLVEPVPAPPPLPADVVAAASEGGR